MAEGVATDAAYWRKRAEAAEIVVDAARAFVNEDGGEAAEARALDRLVDAVDKHPYALPMNAFVHPDQP